MYKLKYYFHMNILCENNVGYNFISNPNPKLFHRSKRREYFYDS